jgi:hypothetical protein
MNLAASQTVSHVVMRRQRGTGPMRTALREPASGKIGRHLL